MKITRAHRYWLAAIAFAVLTACSNGRGSVGDPASPPASEPPPPPPVPPTNPPPTNPPPTPPPEPEPPPAASAMAGYWKGTATNEDSNRTFDAVALIDADGNAQWLFTRGDLFNDDDGFVVFANVCCETQFAANVTGKELGETKTHDGSIETSISGTTLGGELRFRGDQYGFTLNRSSDYDRSVSLAALAGVYTRNESTLLGEEVTLTMTIAADGGMTGSYSNGCVFNGNASIPDSSHNMVRLQIDLANCGETRGSSKSWNGAYAGLGVLLSGDDTFYHSVIGPAWLGPQTVER